MSLRLKFGVLLALLGLSVLLIGAASWWTFENLRLEVREPIRSMTHVLQRLGEIKRDVERLGGIVTGASEAAASTGLRLQSMRPHHGLPQESVDEFNRVLARVTGLVREIGSERETAEEWALRTSKTSLKNIEGRLAKAKADGTAYLRTVAKLPASSEDPATPIDSATKDVLDDLRTTAAEDFFDIHELIERMESRLIVDAQAAIRSSDTIRMWLLVALASAFGIVALMAAMGVGLVRRWVLKPVEELRLATAKIAEGEYTYRIPLGAKPDASDELLRLSAEVNDMAGMVKTMQDDRVEREKLAALGEMVRRLAHNLRNPLAGIRGLAEVTRSDLPTSGPQSDLRENQSRIITAVDRFEKWLNDLLTATRPMQIVPEMTAVPQWLTGLVDAHRPMAQSRGVVLTLNAGGCPGEAVFDSRHLEHAVSAILSNAIEATSSPQARGKTGTGGTVVVSAACPGKAGEGGQSAGYWSLSIADQGSGVPADLQDKVFRPYFTTKQDGNGIGLAVALQVVKAHGGQIRLESPWPSLENGSGAAGGHSGQPAGTRFTIELPMNRPALAGEDVDMASIGRDGAIGGQNSRHRG